MIPRPAFGLPVLLGLLVACINLQPRFVSKADIDKAVGHRDMGVICVGLTMEDAETRSYAAEKIVTLDRIDKNCFCDHLVRDGRWDAAVLQGARKGKLDERVGCAATLVDDPAQPDRPALVAALLDLKVPAVRSRLAAAAASDPDLEVRAAAIPVFTGTKDAAEVKLLTDLLTAGPPPLSLSAIGVLSGRADAAPALRAATAHADPSVRSAAVAAYQATRSTDTGDVLCAAMKDSDPTVRAAAIAGTRASRDDRVLGCLRESAFTEETDAAVRLALVQSLAKNAAPAAADILCEVIPFWVRTYVKDVPVQEESVEDIVHWQNDRDFERSYACAESAVKAGGYTCWGRAYLGARFREFGGKTNFPRCPGAEGTGGGGGREIAF